MQTLSWDTGILYELTSRILIG